MDCSFCHKSQDQVKRIITGPSVAICDECVDVCDDILLDPVAGVGNPDLAPASRCALCGARNEELVTIGERGVLCADCIDAVLALR